MLRLSKSVGRLLQTLALLFALLVGVAPPLAHAAPPVPAEELEGPRAVVPAGREARAIALLGPAVFEKVQADGTSWSSISLQRDRVVFTLTRGQAPVARLVLRHASAAGEGDRVGEHFALRIERLDPAHAPAAEQMAAGMLAREDATFFQVVGRADPVRDVLRWVGLLLGVWAVALLAWLVATRSWHVVKFRFQPTHLLPAVLQVVLYTWWAWHVPAVTEQVPRILLQVAFAYAFDFLLGLTLKRRWDATFGPIPVVLSANLFVWFPAGAFHLALVVVGLALLSKWTILRKDPATGQGRHVFNPSAFGIAVVGLASFLLPDIARFQDISHLLAEPPRMVPLLLALAVVAQLRVPIVLITLSSTLVLLALKHGGAYHVVYPFWPAVLLALTLLATDPATIPKTGAGRLLYGLSLGLLVWGVSAWLTWRGYSDFFGKVLPIPVLNLLVPLFDRLGAWLTAQSRRQDVLRRVVVAVEPRWNVVHVGTWLLFATAWLTW